ncbi:pickpocket protein 28-like isoform X1 [Tigriopus californicus]|uniref:pickpocket protein 28-like isoform X1 n=1 Tax=Tigriopus californicus TaxID=6832 RepID=UPI0027DA9033|nr:pickpocket protein 28-like isoform X1 [Tigriopus californicus]
MPKKEVWPTIDQKTNVTPTPNWEGRVQENTKEYFEETSLHGLKYLAQPRVSKPERVFWFVAVFLSWFFSGYMIYQVCIKWQQSPVLVSFDSTPVPIWKVPFPSFTVCNMNKVMRSKVISIEKALEQNQSNPDFVTERMFVDEICGSETASKIEGQHNLNLTGDDLHHFLSHLSQPCSSMMLRCHFEGFHRNCGDIFTPVITDEGQCCAFNIMPESIMFKNTGPKQDHDEQEEKRWANWDIQNGYTDTNGASTNLSTTYEFMPRRALAPGLHMGLSVMLDVQESEYFCTGSESVGFKALFHTPATLPEMIEYGFAISPGSETFFTINPTLMHAQESIHGISYTKRQCYLQHEKDLRFFRHYTFLNCFMECVSNFTFRTCGCVAYYMPRNSSYMPICGPKLAKCVFDSVTEVERSTLSDTKENKGSGCECLPPCTDINFPHVSSTTKLRSSTLKMSQELKETHPKLLNDSYVHDNVAIVNIFFKDQHFMRHERSELFGITDFFANIGGLMGLCMGFSILSLVEFVYFFSLRLILHIQAQKSKS